MVLSVISEMMIQLVMKDTPTQEPSFMTDFVPIAHFELKYQISSQGGIWNLEKQAWQSQIQSNRGYMMVSLFMNGRREHLLVHRLVAKHFLPNPYDCDQVNHRNGDKSDNRVKNLEWMTQRQNIQHSLETSLRAGYMPMKTKLALVERVLGGELIRELAHECGRREESLSSMLRRAADEHGIGDAWKQEMKRRRTVVAIRNLKKINL